jgi:F-type H+-transporting ATPase subunit gamma
LLTVREQINKTYLLFITSDRGLCGAYNTNIVAKAERFIKAIPTPVEVIAVGRKGRDLMIRRGYNVVAAYDDMPDPPSVLDISAIARTLTEDYL